MPELPEVETVCRGLNQLTLDLEIVGGEVLHASTIAHPLSAADFLAGLKGKAIAQWSRRGKYLLADLDRPGEGERREGKEEGLATAGSSNLQPACQTSPSRLAVHLRMTGQLLWLHASDPLQKHTRVRLFLVGDRELRFVDQRTFGQMWWVPPGTEPSNIVTGLQQLGPEPFSQEFSVEYFASKLKNRQRPIKSALLDQTVVAGLGNIYADEALFLAGVRSTTPCSELTPEATERLHRAIVQVLQSAIAAGGTTFSNFLNVYGVNGNYGGVAWVYNRAGQPCRTCGTPIQRLKLAGRSTHFCPECQQ